MLEPVFIQQPAERLELLDADGNILFVLLGPKFERKVVPEVTLEDLGLAPKE